MLSSSFNEYKIAIGILRDTSKHIALEIDIIKNKILSKLTHRGKLLDVGAGAGDLAKALQNEFDKVVAVEVNTQLKNAYDKTNIELYTCDFMQAELKEKFDLIICSHVMYHLNKSEMSAFIDKLLSLVNPGGYCFITLMAARGQNHRFHAEFNPDYVNSNQIITILNERNIKYERIEASNSFTTNNEKNIVNLLEFFAIEDCQREKTQFFNPEKIKQIKLATERQATECLTENGYELKQEEDYFIVPRL